jgi:hypothetical protein
MSRMRTIRTVIVRLERAYQLIHLRGSLFDSPRLADLASGPERARLFKQMLPHIRRSQERTRLLRHIVPSSRFALGTHGAKHTPARRLWPIDGLRIPAVELEPGHGRVAFGPNAADHESKISAASPRSSVI